MSDVTSIMDVKNAFAMKLRRSEVVPAKSRVDEPLHQKGAHATSDVPSRFVTRRLSLAV